MHAWMITNAEVITPTEVLSPGFVWVEGTKIREIGQWEEGMYLPEREGLQVLDAKGAIVMPGIIDIHTDAMDMEIIPRPGADIPIAIAARELERKMSACGITTVFHSLHLGYESAETHSRSKYSRNEVFAEVSRMAAGPTLLHNKIHLRFELSGIKAYEECLALLEGGSISLLSVMDHTPGQGQFNKTNFKAHILSQGKSESEFEEELALRLSRPKVEGEQLSQLIDLALELGIAVASHDDDSIEKVDNMLALGVQICEFPITMEAAAHASSMGMHVAGGASNVLRGGSLSGNLRIAEAVTQGAVGILCSDYYPASILHSIFRLHRAYGLSLPDAVNLASLHPAQATGLAGVTGSLEEGKEADLLVVRLIDDIPMVTHTMVAGSMVMQTAHK